MKPININPKNLEVGQEIPTFQTKVEAQKYRKYNRLIREINPIHFNKNYAQKLGYEKIVVAGNFLFTYVPKWIIDWVGEVNVIQKITIKFENPVYPDEEIIHEGMIVKIKEENGNLIVDCEYKVKKVSGERTSSGTLTLSLKKKK